MLDFANQIGVNRSIFSKNQELRNIVTTVNNIKQHGNPSIEPKQALTINTIKIKQDVIKI
ncbi:hypothetical protein LCGC14_2621560 [marine sediment metagenome]|uniref:Uncharacterized protein n=1 Tax=marine sediment metagenome TaxID=412755 RepID=A0A0F9CVI5_9ZZZZ